jgi:hypothetical protein
MFRRNFATNLHDIISQTAVIFEEEYWYPKQDVQTLHDSPLRDGNPPLSEHAVHTSEQHSTLTNTRWAGRPQPCASCNTFQTTFLSAGSCRSKALTELGRLYRLYGEMRPKPLHHCACADICPDFLSKCSWCVSFTYEEGTMHRSSAFVAWQICCRSRRKCLGGDSRAVT